MFANPLARIRCQPVLPRRRLKESIVVLPWFENRKGVIAGFVLGVAAVLAVVAASVPNFARSTDAARIASSRQMAFEVKLDAEPLTASYIDIAPGAVVVRKIAHTSDFDLIVVSPSDAVKKIDLMTERLGGYLVTSQVSGTDAGATSITVRIPVAQAEEAKAEIRKLALRIESEKTEAEDVTKQWVDTDANLRNLRATEQQYLQILKRATSVKDTVEVTDKLSEIRGTIEQQQAEFNALTKRVETVAISVDLLPDADVQVFGLHWRPLYRAKLSMREALDAIGDYSATMFAVIVHIHVILLWIATLVAFAAMGWKLLRWVARVFFGWKPQSKT
jgi:Domain of unknown function (DUF4349)